MPCDIGYRSVARATVEKKTPAVKAPPKRVDEPLIVRLAAADPAFVSWLRELDAKPLLDTLQQGGVIDLLRMVCELLDYNVVVSENGKMLEAEKTTHSGEHHVHEYLCVVAKGDALEVRFEHFASDDALAVEQARFLALAQKLGLTLRLSGEKRAGQKIPKGAVHPHLHKNRGKS
ncbi:MAG: hypothetical protein IT381_20385 [Deltaproteobacteria bacterium]|nr:hypothetical protein [Deltaproteobacteria bacterium]